MKKKQAALAKTANTAAFKRKTGITDAQYKHMSDFVKKGALTAKARKALKAEVRDMRKVQKRKSKRK